MNIPEKILIKSDENILKHNRTIKTKNDLLYEYVFVKSETKLGLLMTFTEKELSRLMDYSFIEI